MNCVGLIMWGSESPQRGNLNYAQISKDLDLLLEIRLRNLRNVVCSFNHMEASFLTSGSRKESSGHCSSSNTKQV